MTDDIHSLAALYALDALDDLETRRFETHLDECGTCRDEVAAFREAAASIAVDDLEPSPALRASTLSAIASTPQVPAHADDAAADEPGTTPVGRPSTTGSSRRRPSHDATRSPKLWVLGAAAAAVVVVAIGVVIRMSGGGDTGLSGEVAAVLEAPDATRIALHSDDPQMASVELELVHSAAEDATVLVGDDLAGTEPGLTYQMWGITDEGAVGAGVFQPDDDGTVETVVDAPEEVEGWAVTVEPAGGSPEATTDPVFTTQGA